MVGLGLLSIAVAAAFFLVQRDYKRLFAYSSIEHIGIAFVGFGIGGPGIFAGVWHLLNHALAKSMAFYGTGLVLLRHQHRSLDRTPGLLRQMPLAGLSILAAGIVLGGLPPFGLFVSEVLIVVGAYTTRPTVAYLLLALLAVAFATLLHQVLRMVLGRPLEEGKDVGRRCRAFASAAVGINLVALGAIGLQVPDGLRALMGSIVTIFSAAVEVP
jgi:hydrogenase-4 component F